MPEPTNCTPMQISRNPISLLSTCRPDGPMREAQNSLERRVIQAIRLVNAIARPVIANEVIWAPSPRTSAISVEKPMTTAMVPGPAMPGMASGKNA